MNSDGAEHMNAVDLLIKIAIFACFIVFAMCMWFIRRERDKRKKTVDQNVTPPEIRKG